MSWRLRRGLMPPGQRATQGARNPPSQVVPFSPRKGSVPPSGHENFCAPLSEVRTIMVLSAMPQVIELLQKLTDDPIEFHHPVRVQTVTALVLPLRAQASPDVHARRVVPEKERPPALHGFVHEIERDLKQVFFDSLHTL